MRNFGIPRVTSVELRTLLSYDEKTGIFRWLVRPNRSVRAGDVAGALRGHGYVAIGLSGKKYAAHRLAWLYVHGEWPSGQIDHIDGDRSNNAIANLRDATNAENQHNKAKRGYSWHKREKKFVSTIRLNGKRVWLGYFQTAEDARAAYEAAEERHFGDFCFHRRPSAQQVGSI